MYQFFKRKNPVKGKYIGRNYLRIRIGVSRPENQEDVQNT